MRSGLRPISMLSPTFRSRLTSRRDSTHTSPACGRPPACSAANGAAALLSWPRRVAVADRLDAAELDALVGGDHAGKLDAVGVAQAQTGAAFDLFGACRLGTVEHQVGAEELGGAGEHGAVQAGAEIADGGARGDRDQQGEEQHAQLALRDSRNNWRAARLSRRERGTGFIRVRPGRSGVRFPDGSGAGSDAPDARRG